MTDWSELTKELKGLMRSLRGDTPDVMKAFSGLAQAALAPKALDCKTKELIAIGISVAFHVKAAMEQGATRQEVVDVLGMAIYMGAGPSVMYASHAIDAFEQYGAPAIAPATTAA
jgi:AhpD family alkylhydroperoxidase